MARAALHRGGLGSIPGQAVVFVVDKVALRDMLLLVFQFSVSVSFHLCSVFIYSYITNGI
jgi:hypothetical protein